MYLSKATLLGAVVEDDITAHGCCKLVLGNRDVGVQKIAFCNLTTRWCYTFNTLYLSAEVLYLILYFTFVVITVFFLEKFKPGLIVVCVTVVLTVSKSYRNCVTLPPNVDIVGRYSAS